LEPIFEPLFDDSGFGYRPGQAKDALRKMWREIEAGAEWIVDADLKDYFGSVNHEKLMTLVGQGVADGRVLTLIEQMLTAGYMEQGHLFPTPQGTPQGNLGRAAQSAKDADRARASGLCVPGIQRSVDRCAPGTCYDKLLKPTGREHA
jgi:retron-type reverse transcriptase